MKSTLALLLTGLIALFSINLFPQQEYTVEYKIGPKDLLEISVFGQDELNKTVRVSEDGKITFPLLGEVEVEGLTKVELEKKLSRLLEEKYLHNPQVTIFIKEYQSKRVSVLGAVKNPGRGMTWIKIKINRLKNKILGHFIEKERSLLV